MVDNGNGSYSYTYSVQLDGAVTVLIQLKTTGNVFAEYYPNSSWSGSVSKANYTSTLDMDWGGGDIISGFSDNVSAYFVTWLKPQTTETYTIYLVADDGSSLWVNDVLKINRSGVG